MAKKMDAHIHICNQQTMDGQSETIEMDVLGALTQTQDGFLLTYTEYDEDANRCDTTVRVTGSDTVSVTRSGNLDAENGIHLWKNQLLSPEILRKGRHL